MNIEIVLFVTYDHRILRANLLVRSAKCGDAACGSFATIAFRNRQLGFVPRSTLRAENATIQPCHERWHPPGFCLQFLVAIQRVIFCCPKACLAMRVHGRRPDDAGAHCPFFSLLFRLRFYLPTSPLTVCIVNCSHRFQLRSHLPIIGR
jgi:hypothetical protein